MTIREMNLPKLIGATIIVTIVASLTLLGMYGAYRGVSSWIAGNKEDACVERRMAGVVGYLYESRTHTHHQYADEVTKLREAPTSQGPTPTNFRMYKIFYWAAPEPDMSHYDIERWVEEWFALHSKGMLLAEFPECKHG